MLAWNLSPLTADPFAIGILHAWDRCGRRGSRRPRAAAARARANSSTDVKRVRLNEEKVFIAAPGTSRRSPRRPEEAGDCCPFPLAHRTDDGLRSSPLLLQGADVGDDFLDLGIGQLAVVGRHFAFAVFGGGDERSVGALTTIGILEGRDLHHLAHRRSQRFRRDRGTWRTWLCRCRLRRSAQRQAPQWKRRAGS